MLHLCAAAVTSARAAPAPPAPPSGLMGLELLVPIGVSILLVLLTTLMVVRKYVVSKGNQSSPEQAAAAEDAYPRGPLVILWGSQTGTAESFGNVLMREAKQHGFKARSVDLEDYDPYDLKDETAPVVFLMATHGEGEPTDNAVAFFEYMHDKDARTPGVHKCVSLNDNLLTVHDLIYGLLFAAN